MTTLVLFGVYLAPGCGSTPLESPAPPADVANDSMTDAAAATENGAEALHVVAPASPSEDPRLVEFASGQPGASLDGWDWCQAPTPLSRAPDNCSDCPAPTRGTSYLRYTGGPIRSCGAGPGQVCPPEPDSQIYGYFTPELAAASRQAVWFDLIHIAGDSTDATLTLYATDSGCTTLETLGTWGISDILSKATGWLSTCVSITPHHPTAGIGFRFAGTQVDLGMQGPWFGSACPTP
jgi:hypothetical protein